MSKTTNSKPYTPSFGFDFSKMFADFKWPAANQWSNLDFAPFTGFYQKNIETMTTVNQLTTEGLQAIAKRQAEIARNAFEEMSAAVSELVSAGTPEDKILRQIELSKQTYETTMNNLRELAVLAAKSNEEAAELWADRIATSFDDVKTATKKATKKVAA